MLLGNICTRPCGFCAVERGRPAAPEVDEPERVAEAAWRLGLKHVVLTSVARDDLPDGGAEHFRQCVEAVRQRTGATVEVLVPDFRGDPAAIDRVLEALPDVFNHNLETVRRLTPSVRSRAKYDRSLEVLRAARELDPVVHTKSGLMLGLGETEVEILETLGDLRRVGCEILTLGQYLQPTLRHLPVREYVTPERFARYGELARQLGFTHVASGPLVRSSYHADDFVPARRAQTER
jgi:lipoic acid synthetase